MATLKLKHMILYVLCFILLYYSRFPAGALLALAAWLQLAVLLWKLPYNGKTQKHVFYVFLSLLPLTFFWGAVVAFTKVYLQNGDYGKMLFMLIVNIILSFWCLLFYVFSFHKMDEYQKLSQFYALTIQSIPQIKKELLISALLVSFFALIPVPILSDYYIVLAIILLHLVLKRSNLILT